MYCASCGHEISGTARFCPWCGAATPGGAAAGGAAPRQGAAPQGVGAQSQGAASQPQPQGVGAQRGAGAQSQAQPAPTSQPAPAGWDPADVSGVRPGAAPALRRRRWPVVVLVVVLVAAFAGGGWWLWSSEALSQLLGSDATDESFVVYYGADAVVAVTSTTRIVLYGSEGDDPLEDYDVWFLDEDGTVEAIHVDGDSFTAESLGVGEGMYSLVAQDPDTSEVYAVGSITVAAEASADAETDDTADADAESSGDSGSGDALVVYEDEVAFRPAGTDDESDADAGADSEDDPSATQLAYLLYYQKVLELQATYGEASVDEDADALEGLCVLLVDLDADGLGELVVAYPSGDEEYAGSYRIEVWCHDASALALEQVCWMLSPNYFGVSFSVREVGDTTYLVLSGIASASGYDNVTLVFGGEDGSILYYSEDTPHEGDGDESTIVQMLYGSELTEEEASAYEELADVVLYSYDAIERYSLAGTFSTGGSTYSPSQTATASEAAIRTIVYGIFGLDTSEDDETEATGDEAAGETSEASYAVEQVEADQTISYYDEYADYTYSNESTWTYPQIVLTGGDESAEEVVNALNANFKADYDETLAAALAWTSDSDYVQTLDYEVTATILDEYGVVAVRSESYETLWAAHGWGIVTGQAYSLATGEAVAVEDVLGIETEDLEALATEALRLFLEENPSDLYDDDSETLQSEIEAIVSTPSRYYLCERGVVVCTGAYELGSFAYGMHEVLVVSWDGTSVGTDLA